MVLVCYTGPIHTLSELVWDGGSGLHIVGAWSSPKQKDY